MKRLIPLLFLSTVLVCHVHAQSKKRVVGVEAINNNYGGIDVLEQEIIDQLNGYFAGSPVIFVSHAQTGRKDFLLRIYYKLSNAQSISRQFESGWKKTKADLKPNVPGMPVEGLSIGHEAGGFEYGVFERTPGERQTAMEVNSPGTQIVDFNSPAINYQFQQRLIQGPWANTLLQARPGGDSSSANRSASYDSFTTIRYALESNEGVVWQKRFHSAKTDVFHQSLPVLMELLSQLR